MRAFSSATNSWSRLPFNHRGFKGPRSGSARPPGLRCAVQFAFLRAHGSHFARKLEYTERRFDILRRRPNKVQELILYARPSTVTLPSQEPTASNRVLEDFPGQSSWPHPQETLLHLVLGAY